MRSGGRSICVADADDRPVAGVHLDVRVAGVDDPGGQVLALVAHLDRHDPPRLAAVDRLVEGDDAVLDGDEVAVPEVPGRAVAGLAEVVVGVQLDEAVPPLAQQAHRHQAHLALELALDLLDHRALRRTGRGDDLRLPLSAGAIRLRLRLADPHDAAGHIVERARRCRRFVRPCCAAPSSCQG